MNGNVITMVAVGIAGFGIGMSSPVRAEQGKAGDHCQKHCNAIQLQNEVESLEKELKQSKASGSKLIEAENKKAELRKHIAQHQTELNNLQARLDGNPTGRSGKETKAMYHCPMHPEVTSDKPGKCSKCGMNLEKTTK